MSGKNLRKRTVDQVFGWFNMRSVSNKAVLVTKGIVLAVIGFYILTAFFPENAAGLLFLISILVIASITNWIFHTMISKPLAHLNDAAREMAALNLGIRCSIHTKDELEALAENLNRMAANLETALSQRKELTDTLSHEMKTPLGVIKAYGEGILDENDTDRQRDYAKVIVAEAEKMGDMINGLLDLSALEAGAVSLNEEPFDLVELVEACAGRQFIDAPQGAYRFCYDLPDQPCFVLADRSRMEQVINNFMGNAKKFVAPNGVIRLYVGADQGTVKFELYNDCEKENLKMDLLWQTFYRERTEHNSEGSGLGLAIVEKILNMHGFLYGAESTERGILFFFQIGLKSPAAV